MNFSREQLEQLISSIVDANGIELLGVLVEDPESPGQFYQQVKLSPNATGNKRHISSVLSKMSEAASAFGFQVDFIAAVDEFDDSARLLLANLQGKYANDILACDVVLETGGLAVVVVAKEDPSLRKSVKADVEAILSGLNQPLKTISFSNADRLPKALLISKIIRQESPIDADKVFDILINKGFEMPNRGWLDRVLDQLRKRGMVVRRTDGAYIVTYHALRFLGTEKGRGSPDISRGLALARRYL